MLGALGQAGPNASRYGLFRLPKLDAGAMILFAADDHCDARPGAVLHQLSRDHDSIPFLENDWAELTSPAFRNEGAFVQCYESGTPWGRAVVGFLPGHRPESFEVPAMFANCRVSIDCRLLRSRAAERPIAGRLDSRRGD